MLSGFYREGENVVSLRGYDIGETFIFYLSCPLKETRKFIDGGITIVSDNGDTEYSPATWDNLYISVGTGKITVSTSAIKEDNIIYYSELNKDFLSRLGSFLRGIKRNCVTSNRDDYLDILVCSNEFNPNKISKYTVKGKSYTAKVTFDTCNVTYIEMGDDKTECQLVLEEDGNCELKVNKTSSVSRSFKLDLSEFAQKPDESDWGEVPSDKIYSISEIVERNPDKNYHWLKDRKYKVVTDIKEVEEVCKEIYNHNGVVCFDTETTGLNFTFKCLQGEGDRLVGMVFSIREGEAWYFPVAHKHIKNICTPDNENFIIEKYFKPILEKKDILCHNGAFDWKVMYVYGIFMNLVHDTLIMLKVSLQNEFPSLSVKLKGATAELLHRDSLELVDFVEGTWGSGDITFDDLPEESVKYYACADTDNTLSLLNYGIKENLFDRYNMRKIYQTEVAFSIVIAYQEFYGHCADVDRSAQLAEAIKENKAREYSEMVKIVGHDFNPRSSKELTKVMFEELEYPIISRTATGNPSADKKTIKWFTSKSDANGNPVYPFAKHLKVWRDNAQLESNFINVLGELSTNDGFMFSSVNQFLETGRVSVNSPNYQSYNDVVKKYIVPRRGYYMMDSDYSSIEYRILSSMAGQENLIEKFKDPDTDYHTYQASRMFGVPYELVTKELRSQAKGVNFGLPYGMADPSLGEHIFGAKTPENTAKARKLRKLYFEGQEKIEQFFIKARRDGVQNSFSETFFGRRRYFDKRLKDKGSIEREAGNNRIQGTAADIYKIGMVRLLHAIRKNGWLGKVLISAFVHDECLLEIHKSIDPAKMLSVLRDCMMLEIDGWCPLYIGAGFGTNWYDAKKTEIPVQVQEIIVDNWGTTGLDWWNGDTDRLFDWEVGLINDYKRDRVINYLKNEGNYGKALPPVENGFAHEVLEEILKGRHVDGVVNKEVLQDMKAPKKDTIDNLKDFCNVFGLGEDLVDKANIQRPSATENTSSKLDTTSPEEVEVNAFDLAMMKVNQMGVGIDHDTKRVYFKYIESNPTMMRLVNNVMTNHPGSYEVIAVKNESGNNVLYTTGLKLDLKAYSSLLSIYMRNRQ